MNPLADPYSPIRTCIGCRRRAAAAELLRVVVAPDPDDAPASVVPDPRHRASGRGAWLHPVPECVELAERRRAFGRALRVTTAIDTTPVHEYVVGISATPTSGTPQEIDSHGPSMKRQQ